MSKADDRARKDAIEAHATYGSGPANGPSPEQSLANLRAALARETAKPLHKQQRSVIENLRTGIKAAERNAAAQ
jgi:hypothetical protein